MLTGVFFSLSPLENVYFSLDTSSVAESGTAKVRARPRVKHYAVSLYTQARERLH